MRWWRLLGCLIVLLMILPLSAYAQNAPGGYYVVPRTSHDRIDSTTYFASFWQMPLGLQLIIVCSMAGGFIGLLRLFPFITGKIDDLMKNENRHNIMSYIHSNPGSTIAQVSQAQNIERTTVRYHLYKLESEGKVVLSKMGRYSRIFRTTDACDGLEKTLLAHLRSRNGRSIILIVLENPGITNQELADRLGIEKSAIHWHIDRFLQDGIFSCSQEGKYKHYSVGESARTILKKYVGTVD